MSSVETVAQFLATFACAIFAGAAAYINVVEHPARLACGVEIAVLEWAPSYRRATWMQASLAIIGCLSGVLAWTTGAGSAWLIGAVSLGLVVPFTLLAIRPTNQRLLAPDLDRKSHDAHRLLIRWNALHAVRTGLSLLALVLFLAAR